MTNIRKLTKEPELPICQKQQETTDRPQEKQKEPPTPTWAINSHKKYLEQHKLDDRRPLEPEPKQRTEQILTVTYPEQPRQKTLDEMLQEIERKITHERQQQ